MKKHRRLLERLEKCVKRLLGRRAHAKREQEHAAGDLSERENRIALFAVIVDDAIQGEHFLCLDANGGQVGTCYGEGQLEVLRRDGIASFLLFDASNVVTKEMYDVRLSKLRMENNYTRFPSPNEFGLFPSAQDGTVFARSGFGMFWRASRERND